MPSLKVHSQQLSKKITNEPEVSNAMENFTLNPPLILNESYLSNKF